LPSTVAAAWLKCALNLSKLPKSFVIRASRSPFGLPPPFGLMFSQNTQWLKWPEPWNASARCTPWIAAKSPDSRISASFFSAAFKPSTYALWWRS
jgi:hypothetical protein